MKADYHLHTSFSGDSESPMKDMILQGITLGLDTLCFTEHMDFDFPKGDIDFEVDMTSYYEQFKEYQDYYRFDIELLFGIELGLQPHLNERLTSFVSQYPFDFIIGSSHVVHGKDPYYPDFFKNRLEKDAYKEYFLSISENLKAFSNFQSYGHLDYIVRYGPNKNLYYSYLDYKDVIDDALIKLITYGIGLEVNTAGFKYGLGVPNPHPDVIRRYRELGGEIITIGSDAHTPQHLAYDFHLLKDLLTSCGFSYYTEFRQKKPHFKKL